MQYGEIKNFNLLFYKILFANLVLYSNFCFKMMNNEKLHFVGVFLIRSKDFAVYSHF